MKTPCQMPSAAQALRRVPLGKTEAVLPGGRLGGGGAWHARTGGSLTPALRGAHDLKEATNFSSCLILSSSLLLQEAASEIYTCVAFRNRISS